MLTQNLGTKRCHATDYPSPLTIPSPMSTLWCLSCYQFTASPLGMISLHILISQLPSSSSMSLNLTAKPGCSHRCVILDSLKRTASCSKRHGTSPQLVAPAQRRCMCITVRVDIVLSHGDPVTSVSSRRLEHQKKSGCRAFTASPHST
jgi:hypothetical protein